MAGDMHFPLTTDDNSMIKILEVANVLFDPSVDINLIAHPPDVDPVFRLLNALLQGLPEKRVVAQTALQAERFRS
eukprot:3397875-Rhodomonas_salina.1